MRRISYGSLFRINVSAKIATAGDRVSEHHLTFRADVKLPEWSLLDEIKIFMLTDIDFHGGGVKTTL